MKQLTIEQDALVERAAIMAEANGWSQGRAERHLAYDEGVVSFGELMRLVGNVLR